MTAPTTQQLQELRELLDGTSDNLHAKGDRIFNEFDINILDDEYFSNWRDAQMFATLRNLAPLLLDEIDRLRESIRNEIAWLEEREAQDKIYREPYGKYAERVVTLRAALQEGQQ